MDTQTKILYEMTLVTGNGEPHLSVLEVNYYPIWHIKTPNLNDEGQIIDEGLSKIFECTERDLRFPFAVRVTQIEGEKPKAIPIWDYDTHND